MDEFKTLGELTEIALKRMAWNRLKQTRKERKGLDKKKIQPLPAQQPIGEMDVKGRSK